MGTTMPKLLHENSSPDPVAAIRESSYPLTIHIQNIPLLAYQKFTNTLFQIHLLAIWSWDLILLAKV